MAHLPSQRAPAMPQSVSGAGQKYTAYRNVSWALITGQYLGELIFKG
jgi:hypothetical protein